MIETNRFRLEKERSVLVVVDIQEKFTPAIPQEAMQHVISNTNILIAIAKELGFPILVTEQYPKGLGPTVEVLKRSLEGNTVIEKLSFSCCKEPAFLNALQALGARDVILCGIETHVCVLQTALDLLDSGHYVFVPEDAVASRTKQNWKRGLDVIKQAGAAIGSTEMYLFQMLGVAGTESFKKLSKLIR